MGADTPSAPLQNHHVLTGRRRPGRDTNMETRMTRLVIMTCAGLLTTSAMALDQTPKPVAQEIWQTCVNHCLYQAPEVILTCVEDCITRLSGQ